MPPTQNNDIGKGCKHGVHVVAGVQPSTDGQQVYVEVVRADGRTVHAVDLLVGDVQHGRANGDGQALGVGDELLPGNELGEVGAGAQEGDGLSGQGCLVAGTYAQAVGVTWTQGEVGISSLSLSVICVVFFAIGAKG